MSKCTHCHQGHYVNRNMFYAPDLMAVSCEICGDVKFPEMITFPMRREVPPRSEPVMKKCATEGCHTTIDTRCNNGGLCKACRKVLALQEQLARLQMRRPIPLADRRATSAS